MIYLELSDDETIFSTELPNMSIEDMLNTFEEMVRMYSDLDNVVDDYLIKRAKEINLKRCN